MIYKRSGSFLTWYKKFRVVSVTWSLSVYDIWIQSTDLLFQVGKNFWLMIDDWVFHVSTSVYFSLLIRFVALFILCLRCSVVYSCYCCLNICFYQYFHQIMYFRGISWWLFNTIIWKSFGYLEKGNITLTKKISLWHNSSWTKCEKKYPQTIGIKINTLSHRFL